MTSPALPVYRDKPYQPRPGITAALSLGPVLSPVEDETPPPYSQRDINEMLCRGWVKRHRQRPQDKAWSYMVIGGPK